jgi:hypothetical protein
MAQKCKHKISEAGMRTLANFGIVPIADCHHLKDRPSVAVVRQAKAVIQNTPTYSLTLSTASPQLWL